MISAIIGIIVTLIIAGVVFWAVQQLLPLLPMPEPFRRIIYVLLVVLIVIVVVWVILQLLGLVAGSFHISRISTLIVSRLA